MKPRDVIRIWDKFTRPEKRKIHICVCEGRQAFLRINSNPIFRPNHLLLVADNREFLDHDSYVELNRILRHRQYEISQSEWIGTISRAQCVLLLKSVWASDAFTDNEKQFIEDQLQ